MVDFGRASVKRLIGRDIVIALFLNIFVDGDASVDEILLGQHCLENLLAVVEVHTVQVLCLDFLFSKDFDAVEHAQLRDVVEHLVAIVLLVLNWVERKVKLSQQGQPLDILKLQHLDDVIE